MSVLEQLRGGLIVSCQAYPGEPMLDPRTMAQVAESVVRGGAVGVRGKGLDDLRAMRERVAVPIIGLVENMSYFVPAELPDNKYYIFGKEGGKRLADEYDIPFLGQIPLVQSIREGGDQGVPIMMSDDLVTRKAFEDFAAFVVRSIAMRNANISAEKIAETV